MRTAFLAAVVAILAMATTALAQAPDLASMVGTWVGPSGDAGAITLTVHSVGPKASGFVKGPYGGAERVEAVTLKGDKVLVKFEGGDMTLTVSGGKASGQVSTIGAKGMSGMVSLTRQ